MPISPDAAAAGADGILLLDLPPDEEAENQEMIENSGMKHIRLIAPTTPEARMEAIAKSAEGFIYYVSREGVTGAQESLADTLEDQVAAIRRHTDLPIAVGFGISKPEHARQVAAIADGVVVGSAIVKVIEEHGGAPDLEARVEAFVQPLAAECARS
ncbi:MAG: tryptophan synthase subunit alpha [Verrucomicrobiales bacterium]